ncbi:unnamed protein product [Amoebophrya sp. A120]|nr:unnamed protein product [Amoebophrya sp. A120]|eukprot:GSA120T00016609001.1
MSPQRPSPVPLDRMGTGNTAQANMQSRVEYGHDAEPLASEVRVESSSDMQVLVHSLPFLRGNHDVCGRFFATTQGKKFTVKSGLDFVPPPNMQKGGSSSSTARRAISPGTKSPTRSGTGILAAGTSSSSATGTTTGGTTAPVLRPIIFTPTRKALAPDIMQREGWLDTWHLGVLEAPQGFQGIAYPPHLFAFFHKLKDGAAKRLADDKTNRPWLYKMKTTNIEGLDLSDADISDLSALEYIQKLMPQFCSWGPSLGVARPLLKHHYGAMDPHCTTGCLRFGRTPENHGLQMSFVSMRLYPMKFRIPCKRRKDHTLFFTCYFAVADTVQFVARTIFRNACDYWEEEKRKELEGKTSRYGEEDKPVGNMKKSVHVDPVRLLWKDVRNGVVGVLASADNGEGGESSDGEGGIGGRSSSTSSTLPRGVEPLDGKTVAILNIDVFRPLGLTLLTASLMEDFDFDQPLLSDSFLKEKVGTAAQAIAATSSSHNATSAAVAGDHKNITRVSPVSPEKQQGSKVESLKTYEYFAEDHEVNLEKLEQDLKTGLGTSPIQPGKKIKRKDSGSSGGGNSTGSDTKPPPQIPNRELQVVVPNLRNKLIDDEGRQTKLFEQRAELLQRKYEDLVCRHWQKEAELESSFGLMGATESWKQGGRPAGSPIEYLREMTQKQVQDSAANVRLLLRVCVEYEQIREKARLQEYQGVNQKLTFDPGAAFGNHEAEDEDTEVGIYAIYNTNVDKRVLGATRATGSVPVSTSDFFMGGSTAYGVVEGKISKPLMDIHSFQELPVKQCPLVLQWMQPGPTTAVVIDDTLKMLTRLIADSRLFTVVFENDKSVFYRAVSSAGVLTGAVDLSSWKLNVQQIMQGRAERTKRADLSFLMDETTTAENYRGKYESLFSKKRVIRRQFFHRIKLAYIIFGGDLSVSGDDVPQKKSASTMTALDKTEEDDFMPATLPNSPSSPSKLSRSGTLASIEAMEKLSPQRSIFLLQRTQRVLSFEFRLRTLDMMVVTLSAEILVHLFDPVRFIYCCCVDTLPNLVFSLAQNYLASKVKAADYVSVHGCFFRDLIVQEATPKAEEQHGLNILDEDVVAEDDAENLHDQQEGPETAENGQKEASKKIFEQQLNYEQENKYLTEYLDNSLKNLRHAHSHVAARKSTNKLVREIIADMTKKISDYDEPEEEMPTGAGCLGCRVVLRHPVAVSALETTAFYKNAIRDEHREHAKRLREIEMKRSTTIVKSPGNSPVLSSSQRNSPV